MSATETPETVAVDYAGDPRVSEPDRVRLRFATLEDVEIRDDPAKTGDGSKTLLGHAAVFDRMSLPLYDWVYGEFREKIARGAFEKVLARNPDVHLVYNHDMSAVLARTTSKTLELREDPSGLRVFAKLDPSDPDVQRIAPKMARRDVDQMSFAFTVADEAWLIENPDTADERVIRTILEVGDLYDVSIVAQGAYAQTDANLRADFERAAAAGRVAFRSNVLPRRKAEEASGANTTSRETEEVSGVDESARARRATEMRHRIALSATN